MSNNSEETLKQSLQSADSFSSNVHGVAQDSTLIAAPQYSIPDRYGKDRITLMPINPDTYFLYYELSDVLMHAHSINDSVELYFKLHDSSGNSVYEFGQKGRQGKHYINKRFDASGLQAVCGFYRGKRFLTLLHSNTIGTFYTKIQPASPSDTVYLSKQKGYSEVIRSSMTHFTLGMSSDRYARQIKRLREYEDSTHYFSHSLKDTHDE